MKTQSLILYFLKNLSIQSFVLDFVRSSAGVDWNKSTDFSEGKSIDLKQLKDLSS